jgi:hypothetical protein
MEIRNKEFQAQILNSTGVRMVQNARQVLDEALTRLSTFCLPSREFSIVKTKLEEAGLYAIKAIANDPANILMDEGKL